MSDSRGERSYGDYDSRPSRRDYGDDDADRPSRSKRTRSRSRSPGAEDSRRRASPDYSSRKRAEEEDDRRYLREKQRERESGYGSSRRDNRDSRDSYYSSRRNDGDRRRQPRDRDEGYRPRNRDRDADGPGSTSAAVPPASTSSAVGGPAAPSIKTLKAPMAAVSMIEVTANDRLGGKVRVKCSPDDTIGDLKKLIAAQKGTKPEKIVLKKWYTIYKDHIKLSDYEIHHGMSLEMH